MTVWYLAGKMSGIPQFNFPKFDRVADALRAAGMIIITPSELDTADIRAAALASKDGKPMGVGGSWGDFLARDVKVIADNVDGVILMDGWLGSKGARQEAFTALKCEKKLAFLIEGLNGTYAVREASRSEVSYNLRVYMEEAFR